MNIAEPRSIRLIGACALAAAWLAAMAFRHVNHDVAWYLHMAAVYLDGGTLYKDVVDTNPPLIVFLTIPPVWIARLLHQPAPVVFSLSVCVMAAWSVWLSSRVLARTWPGVPERSRGLIVITLVFLALPFIKGDFGQREHLAWLLAAPYLLAAAGRADGDGLRRAARVGCAMAAGVGLALKPHLLLAWPAIEATVAWRDRRWRRLEIVSVVAALGAYAMALVLIAPGYVAYVWKVAAVYGGLNPPVSVLLRLEDWTALFALVGALVLMRVPREDRQRLVVLTAGALALFAGALLQMKGWAYHLYPARALMWVSAVTLAAVVCEEVPGLIASVRGGWGSLAALLTAAFVLMSGRYAIEAQRDRAGDLVEPLERIVRAEAPEGPVFVMGMLLRPAFPMITDTGVAWPSRHNSLWFLPGLYEKELDAASGPFVFRTPASMGPLEHEFYEDIIGDLCARPPRMLIVERVTHSGPAGRRDVDVLGYYRQDPRFERLFQQFTPLTTLVPFTVYRSAGPTTCAAAPGLE